MTLQLKRWRIYIPDDQDWDISKVNSVAMLTSDLDDDDDGKDVNVVNVNTGKIIHFQIGENPNEIVILIRKSEAKGEISKEYNIKNLDLGSKAILFETKKYAIISDFIANKDDARLRTKGVSDDKSINRSACSPGYTPTCIRACRNIVDYISQCKWRSKQDIKRFSDWFEGSRWEFRVDFFYLTYYNGIWNEESDYKTMTIRKTETYTSGKNPKWFWFYSSDIPIIEWDPSFMADRMKYHWTEQDGGVEFEIGATLSGSIKKEITNSEGNKIVRSFSPSIALPIKLKLKNDDDLLGWDTVRFCHHPGWPGSEYSTGSFQFYIGA